MAVSPSLLDILVCPQDKQPLWYLGDEEALYNERLKRRYPIHNGTIPVLLIDEAETLNDDENQRLLAKVQAGGATRTGPSPSTEQEQQSP